MWPYKWFLKIPAIRARGIQAKIKKTERLENTTSIDTYITTVISGHDVYIAIDADLPSFDNENGWTFPQGRKYKYYIRS